jgi:hypothetical protein
VRQPPYDASRLLAPVAGTGTRVRLTGEEVLLDKLDEALQVDGLELLKDEFLQYGRRRVTMVEPLRNSGSSQEAERSGKPHVEFVVAMNVAMDRIIRLHGVVEPLVEREGAIGTGPRRGATDGPC